MKDYFPILRRKQRNQEALINILCILGFIIFLLFWLSGGF